MPKKPAKPTTSPLNHLRPSDLRAAAQLAIHATHGVANIAEGVHHAVLGTMGLNGSGDKNTLQQTNGISGFVYRTVHGVTELVGNGLQLAFTKLEPLMAKLVDASPDTPEREAVLAALNGVLGDQLEQNHNPLATPMTLRYRGQVVHGKLPLPNGADTNGKLLIVLHGLCMNDLQWMHPDADGNPTSHAHALATAHGYTPVFVRYNTGLHTSQNGVEFSKRLAQLLLDWPVPVESITVLAHSMGGLITRSACAQADANTWLPLLKSIAFLGTPHHGAPLERAGNWVDVVLGSTPFSRPFAKLGQMRSAGITDLRYGHVLAADWEGHDRFHRKPDSRTHLPLPEGVACYAVAATLAKPGSTLSDGIPADGLVPLPSALGQHADPQRKLQFEPNRQTVVYGVSHMELLRSVVVRDQLLAWLG